MEVLDSLRVLVGNVLDSYEMRIHMVSSLMKRVNNSMKGCQLELENMIVILRDNLAKSECLRKKDFDRMIDGVIEHHRKKIKEMEDALEQFRTEEEIMNNHLRKIIHKRKRATLDDIKEIKEEIFRRQNEREQRIFKIFRYFKVEQEEVRYAFKKLLSKGDDVKLKDFKAMLRSLRAQQSDRGQEIIDVMEKFDDIRDHVKTQWKIIADSSTSGPIHENVRKYFKEL